MTDCMFKHYDLDLANLQNTTDSLNIINLSSEMHFSRDILNLTVTVFSLQAAFGLQIQWHISSSWNRLWRERVRPRMAKLQFSLKIKCHATRREATRTKNKTKQVAPGMGFNFFLI